MKLIIGNKNYSSWSLRAWLLLEQAGIPFEEEVVSMGAPDFAARVRAVSPAGRVPVLIDGDRVIWDSLAIAEYLAERHPDKRLWPADATARAWARSICAEMHAGFSALRTAMPMNVTARLPGMGWSVRVQADVDRIVQIWTETRARFGSGGDLLFGHFTIADAVYAPVAQRLLTYAVQVPAEAGRYVEALARLSGVQRWVRDAQAESEFLPQDEPYRRAPRRAGA